MAERCFVSRFRAQQREVRERWQRCRAALVEQPLRVGTVAFAQQRPEQGMIGFVRLQQHLAGLLGAPGTTRDLHDQLVPMIRTFLDANPV